MKIQLKQPIIGHIKGTEECRVHADKDDILPVIFRNKTHFICDSLNYPEHEIVVFNSQCNVLNSIGEVILEDPHAEEKYYHVYEEKSNINGDDPFYTAFEFDDLD